MAFNLIEKLQQSLGFPPLKKIDPNIQEPKDVEHQHSQDEDLGQAAIPAVLAGLFKLSQSENGARLILSGYGDRNWLQAIYEGKEADAVDKIAQYAGVTSTNASDVMESAAKEAVRIIREHIGAQGTTDSVKGLMKDQRHEILSYLPAKMQLGDSLNDNTLDDRTNKMEGPVSSFMHKIENKLSGSDT